MTDEWYLENEGHCVICDRPTTFRSQYSWLRDHYRCERCGTIPRQRALVYVMELLAPDWRNQSIHESSPSMGFFPQQAAAYSTSFFFPDRPLGSVIDGRRCEDLEHLTFADESFDLFLTQDVMEHVFDPRRALTEIMRVLKVGGCHIFTTPVHRDRVSVARAEMIDGSINYLMEAQYHGNPISSDGSLVTWDYGTDFLRLATEWSGYKTSMIEFHDRHLGIDAEFIEVYVCRKLEVNRIDSER